MKIRSRSSRRGANDFTAPAFGVEVEQQPESSEAQVPASAQSARRRRLPGSACNSDPRLRRGEGGSASESGRASRRASTHSEEQVAVSLASAGWAWDLSMNRTSSPKTSSPSSGPAWLQGAEMMLTGRMRSAAQQRSSAARWPRILEGRGGGDSESPAW